MKTIWKRHTSSLLVEGSLSSLNWEDWANPSGQFFIVVVVVQEDLVTSLFRFLL